MELLYSSLSSLIRGMVFVGLNSVNFISWLFDSFHMPLWAYVPPRDALLLHDVFSIEVTSGQKTAEH